ncbi:unnamed protein product [Caenorhabditis brenneri]
MTSCGILDSSMKPTTRKLSMFVSEINSASSAQRFTIKDHITSTPNSTGLAILNIQSACCSVRNGWEFVQIRMRRPCSRRPSEGPTQSRAAWILKLERCTTSYVSWNLCHILFWKKMFQLHLLEILTESIKVMVACVTKTK